MGLVPLQSARCRRKSAWRRRQSARCRRKSAWCRRLVQRQTRLGPRPHLGCPV